MWFEILPSFMIISIATSVPGYALYGLHKWKLGNAYRRGMEEPFDRMMYRRDYRLTGNPYRQNSLETIADEPEPALGGKGKKK